MANVSAAKQFTIRLCGSIRLSRPRVSTSQPCTSGRRARPLALQNPWFGIELPYILAVQLESLMGKSFIGPDERDCEPITRRLPCLAIVHGGYGVAG